MVTIMYGTGTINLMGRHSHLLKLADDIRLRVTLNYMGVKKIVTNDMSILFISSCDMTEDKQRIHIKLPFLKIDMQHGDRMKGP